MDPMTSQNELIDSPQHVLSLLADIEKIDNLDIVHSRKLYNCEKENLKIVTKLLQTFAQKPCDFLAIIKGRFEICEYFKMQNIENIKRCEQFIEKSKKGTEEASMKSPSSKKDGNYYISKAWRFITKLMLLYVQCCQGLYERWIIMESNYIELKILYYAYHVGKVPTIKKKISLPDAFRLDKQFVTLRKEMNKIISSLKKFSFE